MDLQRIQCPPGRIHAQVNSSVSGDQYIEIGDFTGGCEGGFGSAK
jgi:hypothetical protein